MIDINYLSIKYHHLNFTAEELHNHLLNDRIPYINYNSLKKDLEKYYKDPKDDCFEIYKENDEDAYNYLLGRDKIIVLEELDGYHVYSEKKEDPIEEKEMRKKYLDKLKKLDNGDIYDNSLVTNKELINLEIDNNKILNSEETVDHLKKGNYHYGFYDNGLYKNGIKKDKKALDDISDKDVEIEFFKEQEDSMYTILIYYGKTPIEINYFYIPDSKIILMENMILRLWRRGVFFTHFGEANYHNSKEILENCLRVPEWFYSDDDKSFQKLMKIISKIN